MIFKILRKGGNSYTTALIVLLFSATFSMNSSAVTSATINAAASPDPPIRIAEVTSKGGSWPVNTICAWKWKGIGQFANGKATGSYHKNNGMLSVQWLELWFSFSGAQSPLLIDRERNGFSVSPEGFGVQFDINGDGSLQSIQWVASGTDDAFLARDINGNGYIDDGSELFGVGSDLLVGTDEQPKKASNGYEALAQYDSEALGGNEDGVVDKADDVWSELVLWVDQNGDGISITDEVIQIGNSEILSVPLKHQTNLEANDESGNWIPLWSWVTTEDPKGPGRVRMVDIFFLEL